LHQGAFLRQKKIHNYINSSKIEEAFKNSRLVDFKLFDPYGKQYYGTKEYNKRTNLFVIMKFKELMFLYGSLILLSINIQLILYFMGK
jgi:hypothetical protein